MNEIKFHNTNYGKKKWESVRTHVWLSAIRSNKNVVNPTLTHDYLNIDSP